MLNYRAVGSGKPLVVVHGLFGSGENWQTLAAKFPGWKVYLPDLRNHGDSPWEERFRLEDLAADLKNLSETLGWGPCPWIGHSLGGKAVLELGLSFPELVTGIGVLDISPRGSLPHYRGFIPALRGLDLSSFASRSEAQALLQNQISDLPTLRFLLKSLVPDETRQGRWRWKLNLEGLDRDYSEIWTPLAPGRKWTGPALFLRGALSDYVPESDFDLIREFCPEAQIETVSGAGHWLHAEQPVRVLELLNSWLATFHG